MKHPLAGASLLTLIASMAASAANAADATADATALAAGVTVSDVIVTGTRQTGVKAADSAAPIEVVGGQALKSVGQPDLIQTLAQNLPSFNFQAFGNDMSGLTLSAALRGLSPNDTLVLVNGVRRHATANLAVDAGSPYTGSAAADLSFIPVAAIDHVEVLQDGAAAQYGSDAIAGVVNVILKTSDSAGSISATGGQYYEGDGDTGSVSLNKGFSLGGKGFLNLTGEVTYHDYSRQGTCDARFFTQSCQLLPAVSSDPVANAIDEAGIPRAADYPRLNGEYGDPSYTTEKLFYNAGYDLTDEVQLYSFGSYGHRDASAYQNYRAPTKVFIEGPTVASSVVPFPYGFDPFEAINENDYSFTAGLKGKSIGWNWNLSSTYGDDHDNAYTLNSGNLSYLEAFGRTPTNFHDGSFEASEWTSDLDLNRDFAVGLASPLNVAFGGEVRRDTFAIGAGDFASSYGAGAQSFPGFTPSDQGAHARINYSAYIDLAGDPITGLHLDAAGRFEHYSDFGSTEIGKLTARYDFNPMFALRGTVSTGFRAPTLAEEYYSATNVSISAAAVQLPANSPAAALAGFQPLKPEKSTNYSFGFVAHPVDRLQIAVDAYEIDITDRIVNSGFLLGSECSAPANGPCPAADLTVISPGVNAAIAAHGNVLDTGISYTGISIFANAADTRTRGVEATADYASDFGAWGHVDWSAGFNYNETAITKLRPLPAQVTNAAAGQTQILTPTALSALTTATPREKVILGAYYSLAKWSVNLRETVYGPSSQLVSVDGTGASYPGNPATDLKIPVTGITDLDLGYRLTQALRLDVGANNLFDQRPPTVPVLAGGQLADGEHVYGEPDQFSPFGINGGYYYGRVTYDF
ncbi:MAG TPA: TonB-dependent receptor [Caulobacteraceae bacterium]|nr:TonB-dependent receptor [Caulobacteraceae bacterium]